MGNQAGQIDVVVNETMLSNSVSRALLQGTNYAKRASAFNPTVNENAFRQPLGRITGDVDKFGSSLQAANQRVIAFSASASVFLAVGTAMRGMVNSTVEVNKVMIDINSIFRLSSTELAKFKGSLFDVAKQTGQSFSIASESAKEFSRQGLGVVETLKRTRDALILTRMTGLDITDSTNSLTAAVNSFSKSGITTTDVLNKMVAADTAFAVSSKDLAEALTRVGSSAQDSGVKFDELLALVTTMKQVTGRDGAVIGNSLKTILNREERSTTISTLERLGVVVRDMSGNIEGPIKLLQNLANAYDGLSMSRKQTATQLVGGVYQMNQMKALMGDLSKVNGIYAQSLDAVGRSQDEAIKRNEYLNSSLSTLLENFKSTSKEIGSLVGDELVSKTVKPLNNAFGSDFMKSIMDSLRGADKEAEGAGKTIGQSLIAGIGNIFGVNGGIPGAGLLAIGGVLGKVAVSTLGTALKDVGGMLQFKEKELKVQQGIDMAINGANESERARLLTAKSLTEQEAILLDILVRQRTTIASIAAEKNALRVDVISNNPQLAKEAFRAAKSVPRAAEGFLPSVIEESKAIKSGVGGASSSAKPVLIPNFNFGGGKTGPIVANTDEHIVKNFANGGSAIFNKNMISQFGMPEGATKIAAGGYVPNFANEFYRGITPNTDRLTGNPITPFDFSFHKKALFASRDFNEAASYANSRTENVGQFSLNKRLKGLNLFSNNGRNKLADLLESLNHNYYDFKSTRMHPDPAIYDEVEVKVADILRNTKKDKITGAFPRRDIKDIFRTLDTHIVNDALRKKGYDFVTFPDLSVDNNQVNRNISVLNPNAITNKKWNNSYTQKQINELNDPLTIASGYIPNYARRGVSTIKGPQVRYDGRMDFTPEKFLDLFTIFGFDIGDHPSLSTLDTKTLEEFGIKIPKGLNAGSKFPYRRSAAGGLIPESITKAISREISAGAPLSSIYIDSDPRLADPSNPSGILVANRRDEPLGGYQGVNRYKSNGVNPKLAGLSHIPNFARNDPADLILRQIQKQAGGNPIDINGSSLFPNSEVSMNDASKQIQKKLNEIVKSINISDLDFSGKGGDISKQLTEKVKGLVTGSFSNISFGKTSAFSKIADEIQQTRESEIQGLTTYHAERKVRIEKENTRLKTEADAMFTPFLRKGLLNSNTVNSPARKFSGPTSIFSNPYKTAEEQQSLFRTNKDYSFGANDKNNIVQRNIEKNNNLLDLLVQKNSTNNKIKSGIPFNKLSDIEQDSIYNDLQDKSINQLGLRKSGLSTHNILKNSKAFEQVEQMVQNEIAQMSESAIKNKPLTNFNKIANKFAPAAMPLAFMAPMAAGFVPDAKGGTVGGRASGAAQGALQGVGTGAAIGMAFGPEGALIGAALGGIAGSITGMASKWTKSFDEIGREIEEANAKNIKVINDIQLYNQQVSQIEEISRSGQNPKRVQEMIEKQSELYASFKNPEIRKALISGNSEDASRIATEEMNRKLLSGNVVSSASRGANDVSSITRIASNVGESMAKFLGSPRDRYTLSSSPNAIGRVSEKNINAFAENLAASSTIDSNSLKEFNRILSYDAVSAIENFAAKLGLSVDQVKDITDAFQVNELKQALRKFSEIKSENLIVKKEDEKYFREQNNRFQISNRDLEKASLDLSLKTLIESIKGQSSIRKTSNIQSSLIDANSNLSELSKISGYGNIQESALIQSNNLNFKSEALKGVSELSTLPEEKRKLIGDEGFAEAIKAFQQSAKTGDTSPIKALLDNEKFRDISEFVRGNYIKLTEISLSNKAAESELKLANSINRIKASEQQRQNYLNQSTFSSNTFQDLRRADERAGGMTFTKGPNQRGNRLQAILSEQDQYSNLGIVQTDESLSYSQMIKQMRSRETMSKILSQKTGSRISSDKASIDSGIEQLSKSPNDADYTLAGRFRKTMELEGFNAQKEISNLSSGEGNSSEVLAKIMASGKTDEVQSLIAQNTGSIAETSKNTEQEVSSGFDSLFSLLDVALNSNKTAVQYMEKNRARIGAEVNLGNKKKESSIIVDESLASEKVRGNLKNINYDIYKYNYGENAAKNIKKSINKFSEDSNVTPAQLRNELMSQENIEYAGRQGMSKSQYESSIQEDLANLSISFDESVSSKLEAATKNVNDAAEALKVATANMVVNKKPIESISATTDSNITPAASTPNKNVVVLKPYEVNAKTNDIGAEKTDKLSNSVKGFKQGFQEASEQVRTLGDLGEEAGRRTSMAFGDAFAGFVTGSIKGKDAWKSFLASFLSGLAQMYAQQAMMGVLGGLFGGAAPGGAAPVAKNTGGAISLNSGGSILRFASGGKVPALLTGGEYYFGPSAAKAIGQNNLNSINAGTYAGGGLVMGGNGYSDDVPALLDNGGFVVKRSAVQKYGASNLSTLHRNNGGSINQAFSSGEPISLYASGGNVSPAQVRGNTSNNSNTSVSITMNDHRTTSSSSSDDSASDPEFNKRLSQAVQSKVLEVINRERRIGGALRK